jgi:hypothetical protein
MVAVKSRAALKHEISPKKGPVFVHFFPYGVPINPISIHRRIPLMVLVDWSLPCEHGENPFLLPN